MTKIGFDGHDRGSRIVAAYLRDAGMEVIYTPPWQTVETVVKLAIEEDVDVIGLSSLATDHFIVPQLLVALKNAAIDHVGVVVGGVIPVDERRTLIDAGVKAILGPGSSRSLIVDQMAEVARLARHSRARSLWEDVR